MIMPDGEGGVLFSLCANVIIGEKVTDHLTLLLDLPLVPPEYKGYSSMVACARLLASHLNASIVDDNNQPLSELHFAEIAAQVNAFYREMNDAEIPAGSARALHFFN
jgi:FtsZ-interacting cell division protein ZipA